MAAPAIPPAPAAAAPRAAAPLSAASEAQQLGRRLAEASDNQIIVVNIARSQSNELIRQHPELSLDDRKALMATAQQRFIAQRSLWLDKLGAIHAAYFSLPELRAIAAFLDSPAGKRYGERLNATGPAFVATFVKSDFRNDVMRDFCAKTGKGCPTPAATSQPMIGR